MTEQEYNTEMNALIFEIHDLYSKINKLEEKQKNLRQRKKNAEIIYNEKRYTVSEIDLLKFDIAKDFEIDFDSGRVLEIIEDLPRWNDF